MTLSDDILMSVTLELDLADDVRERLEELARFRDRPLLEVTLDMMSTGLFKEEGMLVVPKLDWRPAKNRNRKSRQEKAPRKASVKASEVPEKAAKGK